MVGPIKKRLLRRFFFAYPAAETAGMAISGYIAPQVAPGLRHSSRHLLPGLLDGAKGHSLLASTACVIFVDAFGQRRPDPQDDSVWKLTKWPWPGLARTMR